MSSVRQSKTALKFSAACTCLLVVSMLAFKSSPGFGWPQAARTKGSNEVLQSAHTDTESATHVDLAGGSDSLDERFERDVQPFVQKYCWTCHGDQNSEAELNLQQTSSVDAIIQNHVVWEHVLGRVVAGEMPPADEQVQPDNNERQRMIQWLNDLREREADRNANDPGTVPARRLSHAEFDYSVRDLTGVDLRPTSEFPVDPANTEGFDNSGESLNMSPALLRKYLAATNRIAEHLVLTPRGLVFAPHPCVSETDRDKFCVQRIVEFYRRHDVQLAEYFLTLWRYAKSPADLQTPALLQQLADQQQQSARYLRLLWDTLHQSEHGGPFREIQVSWQAALEATTDESGLAAAQKLAALVRSIRDDLDDPLERLKLKGCSPGSQPLIVWWNDQVAKGRMSFPGDGDDVDLDEARRAFCRIFPSQFAVVSRGHYSNADLGAGVRLLSAGFHLMQGYCRDDEPLCSLVLTESQQIELNHLWEDLNFVTHAPIRQYKDFLFFERAEPPQFMGGPEFDFARPEDQDITSPEKLARMRNMYLKKAQENEASAQVVQAIEGYFNRMSSEIRWIEATQESSIPHHLNDLKKFARKAWRGVFSEHDESDLISFYHHLREQELLSHEDAMRDSIAAILLSPRFCYRLEAAHLPSSPSDSNTTTASASASDNTSSTELSTVSPVPSTNLPSAIGPETKVRSLDGFELASRLSYFLWASLPDDELLAHASAGDLDQPEVLQAQVDRMLKDPKVRGMVTEFAGNWLDVRRFEEHNAVDRDRFPSFNDTLRSAMLEEPIRFLVDLIQRNGSVMEMIDAQHTFVNPVLAEHYGLPMVPNSASGFVTGDTWWRVEDATTRNRGGLLPMSVFLTKNSPGLRTSPVKRGYWVVRRLLGEHIPAPPPNVPELPQDESQLGELTLVQLLAKHRDHLACASCHNKFDSIGLIFEAFGPIGELRTNDLSGNPVQTTADFPDGSKGTSLQDLRQYLGHQRADDFRENFSRKLLSYALGRSLQLSDTRTLQRIKSELIATNQIRSAIIAVVQSPQFLTKREPIEESLHP